MVLMLLTVGFDDFDRWFWWFWCFDSRFWCFWCFDSRFWWFWCFDSRFWWFWQVVLMVLMFWWFWQVVFVFEGCIINDRRFCLLKTLLSGNFAPTRGCVSMAVLWRLFTAVNKKLIVYKNSLLKKSTEHYFSLKSLTTHVTLFTSCFVYLTNVITFKMYDLI